jgi:hypothetical protein
MTDKADNLLLLGEINTYNEDKEDLYNKLILGEAKEFVSTENKQLASDFSTELLSLSINDTFEKFREFFNREYNDNTGIGNYYYDKIEELNKIIEEKKLEQEAAKLELERSTNIQETNKTILDSKYNQLTVQKVYKHLALINLSVLVLINLLNILNKYNIISNTIFTILVITLIALTIIYVLYILYHKYPRVFDDYYKFKFLLN